MDIQLEIMPCIVKESIHLVAKITEMVLDGITNTAEVK